MRFNRYKGPAVILVACLLTLILFHFVMKSFMPVEPQSKTTREPKEAPLCREDKLKDKRDIRSPENNTDRPSRKSSKVSVKHKVKAEKSERWIIVNAGDLPLSHIQHVTDVPGWKLLLYGDSVHNMAAKSCSNCIFVDDSLLQEPENSMMYSSKGATPFLYAIKRGAKWIYLTRTVYNLHNKVQGFLFSEKSKGMMYKDQRMFDAESHFGVSENRTVRPAYWLAKWITPSVQAKWEPNTVLYGSPVYDMTKVKHLPHAFVQIRQLPPLNTKGLLIGYESFWSLVGLLTFHEESSESWRLWRQWLFNDLKSVVGVYPPNDPEIKNLFSSDFKVIGWTKNIAVDKFVCDVHSSFYKCALTLMQNLVKRGMFSESDLKLVKAWFDWLTKQGYVEPKRAMSPHIKEYKPDILHTVLYEPDSRRLSPNVTDPFRDVCQHRPRYEANRVAKLGDIVLVVMFNFPHYYTNIATLNYVYRKQFTNIVFCGQSIGKYIAFKKSYEHPVNFIEVNEVGNGIYPYMCAAYTMDMGFKVAGYLSLSDDILLNVWNIGEIPRDKVWFQHTIRNASFDQRKVPSVFVREPYWVPWTNSKVGVDAVIRVWNYLETMMFSGHHKTEISNFFKTLGRNFGGPRGTFYEASDIFYVPQRLSQHFSLFSKLFYKKTLYLEISIPTALLGGEHLERIVRLNGSYVWGIDRPSIVKYYDRKHVFLHPWKLSRIRKITEEQKMYCEKYLPYIEGNKETKI